MEDLCAYSVGIENKKPERPIIQVLLVNLCKSYLNSQVLSSTMDSSELVNYAQHEHSFTILFLSRFQSHWTVFSSWVLHWTHSTLFKHHNLIREDLQKLRNMFSPFSALDFKPPISDILPQFPWQIVGQARSNALFGTVPIEKEMSQINSINRILNYRLTYG